MRDPLSAVDESLHTLLHAWVAEYCRPAALPRLRTVRADDLESAAAQFERHAARLRESAEVLETALERMRAANERLAARMVEHRAFFDKFGQGG